MAYATGNAANATALRDAIVNLAVTKGWVWDSTGEILSKGSVAGKLIISGKKLLVQAGLGVSGNALVTPSPVVCGITDVYSNSPHQPLNYPLTYHIFLNANPDEIVVAVNYQTNWWQWLAFGKAISLGEEQNTVWNWGTANQSMVTPSGDLYGGITFRAAGDVEGSLGLGSTGAYPFWQASLYGALPWCSIYGNLDGIGWLTPNTSFPQDPIVKGCFATTRTGAAAQISRQPNSWNGESLLIPIQVNCGRDFNFNSLIAQIGHLRYVRNDNLSDGQIVTLGSEEWFTAPAYLKNTIMRNGGSYLNTYAHSGTMGIAVRKTA